jgi:hypothetical protein
MSGYSTRDLYDVCNVNQTYNESVAPGNYRLYQGAYEVCQNICLPDRPQPPHPASLVDVESDLQWRTRIASRCNSAKYPNIIGNDELLTNDSRLPAFITPYACERDIVPTNLKPFSDPRFRDPAVDFCKPNPYNVRTNYYTRFDGSMPFPPTNAKSMPQGK